MGQIPQPGLDPNSIECYLHVLIHSGEFALQLLQLGLEWNLEYSPGLEPGSKGWVQGVPLVGGHRQPQSDDPESLTGSGYIPLLQWPFSMLLQ